MTPESDNKGREDAAGWINFENITQLAIEATLKQGKQIPCLIIDGSKKMMYGGMPYLPETHNERMQFMYAAGQIALMSGEIGNLKQVFLISEGWMSVPKDSNPPKTLPAEDPNRKEVLIVSGLEIQKQTKYLKVFEMLRDKDEILIGLREIPIPGQEEGGEFNISLLDAFRQGFQTALRKSVGRWN